MKWFVCFLGVVLCGAGPTTEPANSDASATSINSAKILLRNKDFAGARLMLKRVTDSDPLYPESLLLLGQCDEGEGNINAAIEEFGRIVAIANADEVKQQAQAAMDALNEGKKDLLKYADQIDRDAAKYKATNKLAFDTLTEAAASLRTQAGAGAHRRFPQQIPAYAAEFQGHKYAMIQAPMTWHIAKAKCEEMGGHLVCIETKEESDFLGKLFPSRTYWIGLTDEVKKGQWQWVNGAPFAFKNWAKLEPSDSGGVEDFAQLFGGSSPRWNDAADGERVWCICEWGD